MNNIQAEVAFGDKYDYLMARAVADIRWPGSNIIRMHDKSDIDWAVTSKDRLIGGIESKKRRDPKDKYPSTIVHRRKHEAARSALRHFRIFTMCAVWFTDGLGYFNLAEDPDGEQIIERGDRDTAVPHVFYNHSRILWLPIQFEQVEAEIKRLEAANK